MFRQRLGKSMATFAIGDKIKIRRFRRSHRGRKSSRTGIGDWPRR
jgi:hypothetical protein